MAPPAVDADGHVEKRLVMLDDVRNRRTPRHIFVFDNMRNRSHLFWRWITTHPALRTSYHGYLLAANFGLENCLTTFRDTPVRTAEIQKLIQVFGNDDTYDSSNRRLEKQIEEADAQDKILFANEHCQYLINHYIELELIRKGDDALPNFDLPFPNPTYIPDRLLNNFKPVMLIRHPVEQVRSVYTSMKAITTLRPGGENFDWVTSLQFSRLIFEYFRLSRGEPPAVIDGDDVLWRTEELGRNFCKAVGIEPDGLKDQWEPLPGDWWASKPFIRAITKTVMESTGIERPSTKADAPDLDRAFNQWKDEYGEQVALELKRRVDAAMPHYEYLKQFKL